MAFPGTKIIFCTYQSAHVIGEALLPGEQFELGIFDEAHKTAGRQGRNYAYALEDGNIPIRKRLFPHHHAKTLQPTGKGHRKGIPN